MEQQYIGCDAHRRYSVFVVMDDKGQASKPVRVEHDRSELREYLRRLPAGSKVAIESTGGWYWLVDEIEPPALNRNSRMPIKRSSAWRDATRRTSSMHADSPWSY